jgi:hypothetical protein
VVSQQTIGIRIDYRLDILGVELQKIAVVAFLDKDVFAIVATVVDMIILAVLERNWVRHFVSPETPGAGAFGTDAPPGAPLPVVRPGLRRYLVH